MNRFGRTALVALATIAVTLGGIVPGAVGAAAKPKPPKKPPAGHPNTLAEVVVKVDLDEGYSIGDVTAATPFTVDSAILASRGIYLVRSTDRAYQNPKGSQKLADSIEHQAGVEYAEPNYVTGVDDTRFHAWPDGEPGDAGTNPSVWLNQPAATSLQLGAARALSRGAGVTVAVLDTGVDKTHQALAGRVVPGWNYVRDNADTADVADGADDNQNGVRDEARGHGTFVSGIVALVAPEAKILPERVLDGDGFGNVFIIAQAIMDAVDSGADVVNLSFGGAAHILSHLLDDAIAYAKARGVVVVAAAGNDSSGIPHFPAANKTVVSVGALSLSGRGLAYYSDYGKWVDLAAPGTQVVGPIPGGSFATWSGTSMAAPFTAGQAALVRAKAPALHADKVATTINSTARKIDNHKVAFGTIDIPASLKFAAAHSH